MPTINEMGWKLHG